MASRIVKNSYYLNQQCLCADYQQWILEIDTVQNQV